MGTKSTFKQLREEERETRKKMIMEAALTLLDEKPLHEVGMRDIAQEARISPASIYRYFPTRDELFSEVLTQDLSEFEVMIKQKLNEGKADYETLINGFIDFVMDNSAKFEMMCSCLLDHGMNKKVIKGYRSIEQYILHLFESAYRAAGFNSNAMDRVQADLCSLIGIILVFINYPDLTKDEKKNQMLRIAMNNRYPDGKPEFMKNA